MRVSHVIHACSERYSSNWSSPLHPTSSSSHSLSISCSPSCTSSTTLRAVVTLRTSSKRRWTQLTNPTSTHFSELWPRYTSHGRGPSSSNTRSLERRQPQGRPQCHETTWAQQDRNRFVLSHQTGTHARTHG